jgi:hypothetical protein
LAPAEKNIGKEITDEEAENSFSDYILAGNCDGEDYMDFSFGPYIQVNYQCNTCHTLLYFHQYCIYVLAF